LANAIPPYLDVGDLDKVIWLGFSDGYLETKQGVRGFVPALFLVGFSTVGLSSSHIAVQSAFGCELDLFHKYLKVKFWQVESTVVPC
jgi:NADH:ubiquinone oxidoreductase subunit 5 (subunit L)/multisubunit Na+/H+ antiporter MnhA subunit